MFIDKNTKINKNTKKFSNHKNTKINKNTKIFSQLINLDKDKLNLLDKLGVVYKIDCTNCNMTYLGQTKRKLACRVSEHKRDDKNKTHSSVLASHVKQTGRNSMFRHVC